MRSVVILGPSIQLGKEHLTNLEFDPSRPYTYCRLCGDIFQPALNRLAFPTLLDSLEATDQRKAWSHKHARTHTDAEHNQLLLSGLHCTPEALHKLVPFGIIPASDIAISNESEHAGLEAPKAPLDDVQGGGS